MILFLLCFIGIAEEKSDQPSKNTSVTPKTREKKIDEKKKESEEPESEETGAEKEPGMNAEELRKNFQKRLNDRPDEIRNEQRDLDEMFQKAKDEKSLEKILKNEKLRKMKQSGQMDGSEIMGPPPLDAMDIPEEMMGPPAPPDINTEDLGNWDLSGSALPPPESIEFLPDEEGVQIEIGFDDAVPPEDRKFVDISADIITRDKLKNTIYLEGNAKVIYEDVIILSEFAEFNDDEEWGKFWGSTGVLAEGEDGVTRCDTLETNFKDKKAFLHGSIEMYVYGREYEDKLEEDAPKKERLKRALGQDDSTIYCDEVIYDWGVKTFLAWVEDSEKVKVLQEGRYAYAKGMYHEKETEYTLMEGDVELWQNDGNWLFSRDVVTDKEDKWANALLKPETTITCDVLESKGDDEILILEGNVLAVQKNKRASADKVINDDKEKILTAEGNVKAHQDQGDWLIEEKIVDPKEETEETMEDMKKPADGQADKFIMWTEIEDFEAEGNVKVWQEHQEASMDKAVYTKKFDRLQVFGNVQVKRENKQDLTSEKGILWLTTKVYEAFGNVVSKGKIDVDKEREALDEEKEEASEEGTKETNQ